MKSAKYQVYYQKLQDEHQQLFAEFKKIHDGYAQNQHIWSEQFQTIGLKVLDLLRDTERRLCSGMMKGGYATYSNGVSEKFWALVKQDYPLIDQVGVTKRVVKL